MKDGNDLALSFNEFRSCNMANAVGTVTDILNPSIATRNALMASNG